MTDDNIIGSGSYGEISILSDDMVLKKIRKSPDQTLGGVRDEFLIGQQMWVCGIAPEYIEYGEEKDFYYIIMERFDGNLNVKFAELEEWYYIADIQQQKKIKKTILFFIDKCMHIIDTMVFDCHMYCVDIKPENFVFKVKNRKVYVKMIDFDIRFCPPKISTIEYDYLFSNLLKLLFFINLTHSIEPESWNVLGISDIVYSVYLNLLKECKYVDIDTLVGTDFFNIFYHYGRKYTPPLNDLLSNDLCFLIEYIISRLLNREQAELKSSVPKSQIMSLTKSPRKRSKGPREIKRSPSKGKTKRSVRRRSM